MITNKVKRMGNSNVVKVTGHYNVDDNLVVMDIKEYKELLKNENKTK